MLRADHLWRRLAIALASVVALALPACSAPVDSQGRSVVDVIRDAVEQAKQRRAQETGGTPEQPQTQAPLETGGRDTFDYDQYQTTLSTTISLLERYWAQALPQLGGRYSDPAGYTYYRSDQGTDLACGQQLAPARNAFYCPAGDFIAWDETGLMIPYYVQGGDFAAAFVLAHEFGHAMQARLPNQEQVGLLRELQADCFAGAWSQWVSDNGLLEAGDLDEATLAVFSARDVPGTDWTDPAAHGSGFERTRAFGDGFESGPQSCYPAPADDWVLSRR